MPSKRSNRIRLTPAQKQHIQLRYENGESCQDIADSYGCNRGSISYHLARRGVVIRPRGMQTAQSKAKYSGVKHHGWNGGRFIDHGYVALLRREHPRADHDGYVKEHRLVVEENLRQQDPQHPALDAAGYLRRDWVVHHINGNKLDNRLANLEPLHRSQHHSWMHYKSELVQLRALVATLRSSH